MISRRRNAGKKATLPLSLSRATHQTRRAGRIKNWERLGSKQRVPNPLPSQRDDRLGRASEDWVVGVAGHCQSSLCRQLKLMESALDVASLRMGPTHARALTAGARLGAKSHSAALGPPKDGKIPLMRGSLAGIGKSSKTFLESSPSPSLEEGRQKGRTRGGRNTHDECDEGVLVRLLPSSLYDIPDHRLNALG